MRVLAVGSMYPPHYLGGQEVVWRRATLHQRAAGHEVRVLTTDYRVPGIDSQAELDDDVHRELRWYWRDHEFPHLGLRRRVALERHNKRVFGRHLAELQPDVVVWWSHGGMSLSLVEQARRAEVPALGVVGDDWMLYGPDVDQWTRIFARHRWLAGPAERITGVPTRFRPGRAGRWLFVSDYLRRRAEERLELPDTGVAHPGIDPGLFRREPAQPWRWRLACIGRIDPRKGVDLAIRVLPHLPEEARLAVVGGGDEAHLAKLHALVHELGLTGRVDFSRRTREELPAIYAATDAVLFPVLWDEPWGLVPLEAMAVGRPVVATGRGGSGEYLEDGENCLLFDPNDGVEALAAAVTRLAQDASLRERLVVRGSATAAEFDETACNERLLTELEAVARDRRRPLA